RVEIPTGGGDHLDVDAAARSGADPADELLLDDVQELGLQGRGDVADLVEEDRAAVGGFEEARPGGLRIGERALLVTEELGLDQGPRERRAVDLDEGPAPPPAARMQEARGVPLAAPRLPEEQHGGGGPPPPPRPLCAAADERPQAPP